MKNIPLVDLQIQYAPLKEEILQRIEQALEGMHLFLGENVQALEAEFASFCEARHGIAVSDGTTALHLILRGYGLRAGDEVITVSHTFFATAEAIVATGAQPVFVDIDPQSYLIDPGQVEARITPNTRAIMPVHLYGQTAEMDSIYELAERHGLKVIGDACQAHGAEYHNRKAGSLADAAAFSFYFSKNLGAYGEGGFITTGDDELARKIRMLRNHGSSERYQHELIGINGRMDEIQAAILRTKLPHLELWSEQRRSHARRYESALRGTPVVTPVECLGNRHVYHLYAIRAPERDRLQTWLKERGIATGIHYPIPCHLQPALHWMGYRPGDLPVTERVASEILSLPMYAELSDAQIDYIAEAIHEFYQETSGPWH